MYLVITISQDFENYKLKLGVETYPKNENSLTC